MWAGQLTASVCTAPADSCPSCRCPTAALLGAGGGLLPDQAPRGVCAARRAQRTGEWEGAAGGLHAARQAAQHCQPGGCAARVQQVDPARRHALQVREPALRTACWPAGRHRRAAALQRWAAPAPPSPSAPLTYRCCRSTDCIVLPDGTPENYVNTMAQVQTVHVLVRARALAAARSGGHRSHRQASTGGGQRVPAALLTPPPRICCLSSGQHAWIRQHF